MKEAVGIFLLTSFVVGVIVALMWRANKRYRTPNINDYLRQDATRWRSELRAYISENKASVEEAVCERVAEARVIEGTIDDALDLDDFHHLMRALGRYNKLFGPKR